MKTFIAFIRKAVDRRDVLGLIGIAALSYGGETLYHGAGYAVVGGVLVAVAVWMR